MPTDRTRQREIRSILDEVLRKPVHERESILKDLCGDRPGLREQVESLLSRPRMDSGEQTPWRHSARTSLVVPSSDRFEIRRALGKGGFGEVFEAYDRRERVTVALKWLRRIDPGAIYRFKRGFRALSKIRHPNLVELYELVADGDSWLLTMELLDGVNFLDHVTTRSMGGTNATAESDAELTASPPRLCCDLDRLHPALAQLVAGVAALHEHGVIHRDIKPSNVWVNRDGRVILLDFGLAKALSFENERGSTDLAGTPDYMAPELVSNAPVSEASDWYSVGVMLYQALTGRLTFSGDFLDVLNQKRSADPVPPSAVVSGVPPELDRLCRSLLSRKPESRPTGVELLEAVRPRARIEGRVEVLSTPSSGSPFVGRGNELQELNRCFENTKGGAVTVELRGQSGIGKSVLVKRFLDELRARHEDLIILAGRCHAGESMPYKALDELVDGLADYLTNIAPSKAEAILPRNFHLLARLFPVLGRLGLAYGLTYSSNMLADSIELRRRALVALRELIARLADRQPLVLFIDDVQWGDVDSAALLNNLIAPPDPPSLLLLLAHRNEPSVFFDHFVITPTSDSMLVELEVGSLDMNESVQLAHQLLGNSDEQTAFSASEVARESHGNPFYIAELARHTELSSALVGEAREEVTLESVIQTRASRLSDESRDLLELVAVAGQPIEVHVARRAVRSSARWQHTLDGLVSGHLLKQTQTHEIRTLEVYHDRVRLAVLSGMSPQQEEDRHARLAHSFEAAHVIDSERLLTHFKGAGNNARAAYYGELAAEAAQQALAFRHAGYLYRTTLELGTLGADGERRVRRALGDVLALAGRGTEAAGEYLRAAELADQQERFDLRRRAADQFLRSGHVDEGFALVRELCRELGLWFPTKPWQVLLAAVVGRTRVRLSRLSLREPDPGVSPRRAQQLDLCQSASFGMSLIDPIRASDFHSRSLLRSLGLGDARRFAVALAGEVANCAIVGGPGRRRGERVYARVEELCQQQDDPWITAFAMAMRGTMAWLLGEWGSAHDLNEKAATIFRSRSTGLGWELSTAQIISLGALAMQGEWIELERRLPVLLEEARERGDLYASVGLRLMTYPYFADLAADQPERAVDRIRGALGEWQSQAARERLGFHIQHCDALFGLVEVALYRGDGAGALETIRSQWHELKASHLLRAQLPRIFAHALRARAALAALDDGDVNERRALLKLVRQDAERLSREKIGWSRGWALLLRAGYAAETGSRNEAETLLERAELALEHFRMLQYVAAVRLRRGGLLGDDEGGELAGRAEEWMRSQKVVDAGRLCDMLVPGGWSKLSSLRTS